MTLKDDEKREVDQMIADRLEAEFVANIFTTMSEKDKEIVAQSLQGFLRDVRSTQRSPENRFTLRWTQDDADVNTSSETSTATADQRGFQNPTLPRWLDHVGGTSWLDPDDPQIVHFRGGGGAADCMFDYLISGCWADEVAAGRGVEGQTFTSLTGCTFKVYSTAEGVLEALETHPTFFPDRPNSAAVWVCPGDAGPCDTSGHTNLTGQVPQTVAWFGSGGGIKGSVAAPSLMVSYFRATGAYAADLSGTDFVSGWTFTGLGFVGGSTAAIRGGSDINTRFWDCQFANGTLHVTFNGMNGWFDNCKWAGTGKAIAGSPVNIQITNCDFTNSGNIDIDQMNSFILANCKFVDETITLVSEEMDHLSIVGNIWATGATNVLNISLGTDAGLGTNIVGNHFGISTISMTGRVDGLVFTGNTMNVDGNATAITHSVGGGDASRFCAFVGNNFFVHRSGQTTPGVIIAVSGEFINSIFASNSPAQAIVYNLTGTSASNQFEGTAVGSGAPTHSANTGMPYFDTTAKTLYINTSTAPFGTTWAIYGTAGGGASAPSPHDFVGTHHDHDTDYTQTPNVDGIGVGGGDIDLYSDNGSTQTAEWDSTTGHIGIGTTINTARAINIIKTIASGAAIGVNSAITGTTAAASVMSGYNGDVTMGASSGTQNTIAGMRATVTSAAAAALTNMLGAYTSFTSIDTAGAISVARSYFADASTWAAGVPGTIYIFSAGDVGGTGATVYPIYVPTQTGTAIHSVHVPAMRIGSVTAPTNVTAGDLTATRLIVPDATIVHSAVTQLGGPVVIPAAGALRFSDTDNSHYTGLAANGTTTSTVTYTLPAADGTSGQVLKTNASGVMSWGDVAHGNVSVTNLKQTMILTAAGGKPTTTSGCAAATVVEAGTNDIDYWVLDFDATTKEYAFWNVVMPDNWDAATITYRVHWTTTSSTNTHTAVFGLQGLSLGNAETIDAAYGSAVEVSDDATATANQHLTTAESSAVTLAGTPAAGDWVAFRLYRDPANGSDDLNVDARVMAVQIEYGVTALSS